MSYRNNRQIKCLIIYKKEVLNNLMKIIKIEVFDL